MRKVLPFMYRTSVSAGLLIAMLLAPSAMAAEKVVARSGNVTVTQDELETFLRSLDASSRQRLVADKPMLERVVQNRLAQKAVLAEAESKGWTKRPEVAAMAREASQQMVMRSYLESISQAPQQYPSDAELQAAYDANKRALTAPKTFHVAQIFVAAAGDEAAVSKARKDAEELAKQARSGDFGAIAKARSQEPRSAANGGDTGWVSEAEMVPEIRSNVVGMKVGAVSEPIRTPNGFHVLKLLEVREAGLRPLAEVRDQLRATMRQQYEADAVQANIAQKVSAQGGNAVDKAALDSVVSSVR
ncbi:hypothetical protein RN01_07155 [Cupriavidus sp. SHE]|jgi:peptidylprolyl isomerase|uniref:Peptidylprolyl isomerase n=1 Tax=Cupriavidus metallidurans TaxID=119219 RepID=A0A482IR16_9BURK|nr:MULTISPECIES: peptidylprolyl isomerase [Cupriavidus]KWR84277.1 hypothetical protein RN01_07155 [Cupriavidus sp. SHE]QBP09977.1 peptidylprolyl isomerase [Cupriavidus metallidurans]